MCPAMHVTAQSSVVLKALMHVVCAVLPPIMLAPIEQSPAYDIPASCQVPRTRTRILVTPAFSQNLRHCADFSTDCTSRTSEASAHLQAYGHEDVSFT